MAGSSQKKNNRERKKKKKIIARKRMWREEGSGNRRAEQRRRDTENIRVKINICDSVEGGSQRYKITKRAKKNRGKCAESTRGRKSGRRKERVEERETLKT